MRSSERLRGSRSSHWQVFFWKFSMQVKLTLKFEGVSKGLTNLEIIFILEICLFASKKYINYQIKFTLKVSFFTWLISIIFLSGNCPSGKCLEMSVWGSVIRGTIHQENVCSEKCPFGEMLFGELSVRKMSVRRILRSRNCALENCPSGKCLWETVHRGDVHHRGNVCWGTFQMPPFGDLSIKLAAPQVCNKMPTKEHIKRDFLWHQHCVCALAALFSRLTET